MDKNTKNNKIIYKKYKIRPTKLLFSIVETGCNGFKIP